MRATYLRAPTLTATVIALLAVTAAESAAQEKSKQAKIERAMEAAPTSIAADATIVDADGTVLREGTNGWTCKTEVAPGYGYPMCNDDVWNELVDAVMTKSEPDIDRIGISYMLAGDAHVSNADPYATDPDNGDVWVQEGPHIMVAVPDLAMLEGLPTDPHQGGPYVMWKGTPYAHVMIPTSPRPR